MSDKTMAGFLCQHARALEEKVDVYEDEIEVLRKRLARLEELLHLTECDVEYWKELAERGRGNHGTESEETR